MADELKRFRREAWDVCWVDTGDDDNLGPFLDSIPDGARRVIAAHLYVIAIQGPQGQCKPIAGKDGLFEVKERHQGKFYRLFCFYSKRKEVRKVLIIGTCYLKKTGKIPGNVLSRALDVKGRAEHLLPPP